MPRAPVLIPLALLALAALLWLALEGRDTSARTDAPREGLAPATGRDPDATLREPEERTAPPLPDAVRSGAAARAEQWQRRLAGADEAEARAAAQQIADALATGAADQALAALQCVPALVRTDGRFGDPRTARERLRPPVSALLESSHAEVRAAALHALLALEPRSSQLSQLMTMVNDPDPGVRARVAPALRAATPDSALNQVRSAVLALLRDAEPEVVRSALRSFGGAELGDGVEARLVELADHADLGPEAIAFGLGRMAEKSDAALGCLLRKARAPDPAVAGAAQEALFSGVPAGRRLEVADLFLELLRERTLTDVRRRCLRQLARYGGPAHADGLEAFLGGRSLQAELREEARLALDAIRRRS